MFAAELSIDCFKRSETNDSDFKISDCLTLYDFGDFNLIQYLFRQMLCAFIQYKVFISNNFF